MQKLMIVLMCNFEMMESNLELGIEFAMLLLHIYSYLCACITKYSIIIVIIIAIKLVKDYKEYKRNR